MSDLRQIIDEVSTEMCEHYCKYPDTLDQEDLDNKCEDCPLNRLN